MDQLVQDLDQFGERGLWHGDGGIIVDVSADDIHFSCIS